MISKNNFSWKVAGEAGHGILNAGLMFAKTCLKGGLHVFASAEYPSLIRGGHNNLDVRVSDQPLYSHTRFTDLLVALDKNSIDIHQENISSNGGIIYDSNDLKISSEYFRRKDILLFDIPLLEIAKKHGGKIMRNVVAMGATIALINFDLELFNQVLRKNFGKKGEEIAIANVEAAKSGYDYAKAYFTQPFSYVLEKNPLMSKYYFMSGNEAIAAGAVKAGCTFMAAYPMTPATSVFTTFISQEKQFNLITKHTEDEIAAMNMAIGASYAGLRAMTATSGGGFALMTEALGLAAQTETPLVVV